jgi:hypothetical protein
VLFSPEHMQFHLSVLLVSGNALQLRAVSVWQCAVAPAVGVLQRGVCWGGGLGLSPLTGEVVLVS